MKESEKTDLPLAADIAAVVSEAAPKLDDLDIEAEAERLAEEHPESDASAEVIAERLPMKAAGMMWTKRVGIGA